MAQFFNHFRAHIEMASVHGWWRFDCIFALRRSFDCFIFPDAGRRLPAKAAREQTTNKHLYTANWLISDHFPIANRVREWSLLNELFAFSPFFRDTFHSTTKSSHISIHLSLHLSPSDHHHHLGAFNIIVVEPRLDCYIFDETRSERIISLLIAKYLQAIFDVSLYWRHFEEEIGFWWTGEMK